jgi:hypothetical protein
MEVFHIFHLRRPRRTRKILVTVEVGENYVVIILLLEHRGTEDCLVLKEEMVSAGKKVSSIVGLMENAWESEVAVLISAGRLE